MIKIILDLAGGTGAWSRPYKEAGYDVRVITLPEYDVLTYEPPENVYGILAAPPCTMFSFARTKAVLPRDLKEGIKIVMACLKIIHECQFKLDSDLQKYSPLKFWTLENPYYGMLSWFLGKPIYTFDPFDFGDNYQKRTALWGYFNFPLKQLCRIDKEQKKKAFTNSQKLPKFDIMKTKDIHSQYYGKYNKQARRAITPPGFAQAFYKANK